MLNTVGRLLKYLWLLIALLVISYAIMVVIAREMLPVINRYEPRISTWLSERTGMEVRIGQLNGLWEGVMPTLSAEDVVVSARSGRGEAVRVNRLSAELDVVASIAKRSMIWRTLEAQRIRFELVEDSLGNWRLGGAPLGAGDGGDLEPLYRMLFYSRLLRIDGVTFDMHFYSGAEARLFARDIRIDNNEGFHRATATLALERGGPEAATLIFEGRGDPAVAGDFRGEGYVRLRRLNLDGALDTIASAWLPAEVRRGDGDDMALDLELWFDWIDNSLVNGRGHLDIAELPLDRVSDLPPVKQVRADVTGWYQPGRDWGLRLQDVRGQWQGEALEPFNLLFRQQVGRHWGELDLAVDYLDLATVSRMARGAGLLEGAASEVLEGLNPRGLLRRVFLNLHFARPEPDLRLRAELDGVALDAWRGIPAARGVDGYLDSGLRQGSVVLDTVEGFAMHYSQAYEDFMPYGASRGKLDWRWYPERERVQVTSNRLEIEGEEGSGRAVLHLDLPLDKRLGDPRMELMVGMRNSHSRYVERYLPQVLDPVLRRWLDSAVGDARIDEAGFIWRGSLDKHNDADRTIQVYARVEDGELAYHPEWPALESASGVLAVDNGRVDAWLESARAGAMAIEGAGVSVRPSDRGSVLRIAARASGDAGEGLALLRDSPAARRLGRFADMEIGGPTAVDLDLTVPLDADGGEPAYEVHTALEGVSLGVPGVALEVTDLRGRLTWDAAGLNGESLEGRLLGEPLEAAVKTRDGAARVDWATTLEAAELDTAFGSPFSRLDGRAAVDGELTIPLVGAGDSSRLRLRADLRELALDLPAPLGKAAGEDASLEADVRFGGDRVRVDGRLGERAAVALDIRDTRLHRGELRLMATEATLPTEPGLHITGRLPGLRWRDWQGVLTAASGETGDWPDPVLDLRFDAVSAGGLELGETRLAGRRGNNGWDLSVESRRVAGELRLPAERSQPMDIRLSRLELPPASELTGGGEGPVAKLLPEQVPAMHLAVERLSIGDNPLGHIAFTTTPRHNGVLVGDIRGELGGILLEAQSGAGDGERVPAELSWTHTGSNEGGRHHTRFSGALISENLEKTLAHWNMPTTVSADFAGLYTEVFWQGRPWEISLLNLDGYVGLDLREGEFHKATGAATNTFFKLVSLLNFDTWLRRLRFDFSDLFSDGVSFDTVEGGFLFEKGRLTFDEPLVASMPSGKIRLLGSADLVAEQLNGRLVATMPVGTNLPWVAGLLGGLPAAAGVFLTGKLFEKQVDQFSSISYRVTGPFDDPKLEVDEIFTDPTELSMKE